MQLKTILNDKNFRNKKTYVIIAHTVSIVDTGVLAGFGDGGGNQTIIASLGENKPGDKGGTTGQTHSVKKRV